MVLFRRRTPLEKQIDDDTDSQTDVMTEKVQDVMKTNLELMEEIVMKIRSDPDFAMSIYVDCPRLQHLLDQHPDLRPIFEDPYLIRINFEAVYREAGGILPEDEVKKPSRFKRTLACIVNHPLFKILRALLIIKKLLACMMGGGFAVLKSAVRGCFGGMCMDGALENIDVDANIDGNLANQANREALNKAADHMEDPEVQEKMQFVLEQDDPDVLDEAIENDPELSALRDSNPLCAELMTDPNTMRILVDPDNLRALGECPDLIETDFLDPDWTPPEDLESGNLADIDLSTELNATHFQGAENIDMDVDGDVEVEHEIEEHDEENQGEAKRFELGDAENSDNKNQQGKGAANKSKSRQNQQRDENQNRGGGFFARVGAGITDYVAAELVGATLGDLMGGGGEFDGLDDVDDIPLEDAIDAAEETTTAIEDAAAGTGEAVQQANTLAGVFTAGSELIPGDDLADVADHVEEGMDTVEENHEEVEEQATDLRNAALVGGAAGYAAGCVVGGNDTKAKSLDDDDEEDTEPEEVEQAPKRKGRFKFIAGMVGALAAAAKEHVTTSLLGDDVGELVLESAEDRSTEKEESKDYNTTTGESAPTSENVG